MRSIMVFNLLVSLGKCVNENWDGVDFVRPIMPMMSVNKSAQAILKVTLESHSGNLILKSPPTYKMLLEKEQIHDSKYSIKEESLDSK